MPRIEVPSPREQHSESSFLPVTLGMSPGLTSALPFLIFYQTRLQSLTASLPALGISLWKEPKGPLFEQTNSKDIPLSPTKESPYQIWSRGFQWHLSPHLLLLGGTMQYLFQTYAVLSISSSGLHLGKALRFLVWEEFLIILSNFFLHILWTCAPTGGLRSGPSLQRCL